jgi:peptide/nickel transport system permease protein
VARCSSPSSKRRHPTVFAIFHRYDRILVLNIYVIEYVFGIPGLGGLTLVAIQSRDVPIILGSSMVIVLFGIVGNVLQDIGYLVLDSRIE